MQEGTKIRNQLKTHQGRDSGIATTSSAKLSDFPIGSVKSRAAARAIVDCHAAEQRRIDEAEYGNLTPFEVALSEVWTGEQRLLAIRVAQMMEERARIFELSLPTPAEIRYGRAVAAEIDRINGEDSSLQTIAIRQNGIA